MADNKDVAAKPQQVGDAAAAEAKVTGATEKAPAVQEKAPVREAIQDAPKDLFVTKPKMEETQVSRVTASNAMRAFKAQVDEYVSALAINAGNREKAINATCSLSSAISTIATTSGAEQHDMIVYLTDTIAACDNGAFSEERPYLYLSQLRKENRERYVRLLTCLIAYAGLGDKRLINERQAIPYVASIINKEESKKSFMAFFPK